MRPELANREPQRVYFSGGTTGKVRPTLYTQWDREVSSLFMARTLYRQGVRPGDIVLNSYQYSTFNGGALFDEAAHHWLNCIVISTSSGNVTPSEKQAQLAAEYGATCIMTTGDHLMRIVDVAKELGYDPRTDFNIRALSGLGDRKSPDEIASILAAVGVSEFYDSYGFHEIGSLGVECPEHDGVHVFEEAYEVQIVDPDTGERLPDGELGAMVVTEFFKTGSPQIRYNTLDLSWLYPREQCACGSWMRRIGAFSGRADNMVKLRGINVWPEAIGLVATDLEAVEPDYFVQARRIDGRDDMVVSMVSKADAARVRGAGAPGRVGTPAALRAEVQRRGGSAGLVGRADRGPDGAQAQALPGRSTHRRCGGTVKAGDRGLRRPVSMRSCGTWPPSPSTVPTV